jgi:hypothetical protein
MSGLAVTYGPDRSYRWRVLCASGTLYSLTKQEEAAMRRQADDFDNLPSFRA